LATIKSVSSLDVNLPTALCVTTVGLCACVRGSVSVILVSLSTPIIANIHGERSETREIVKG